MKNKKFAVLLGNRHIVIKKIDEEEYFDFNRLNPVRIGPHLKTLLVFVHATNKTMNKFNCLKNEIIKDKVFRIMVERKYSTKLIVLVDNYYIVIADSMELLNYFKSL